MKNWIVIVTAIMMAMGTISSVVGISIFLHVQNTELDIIRNPDKYENDDFEDYYESTSEKKRNALIWIDIGMGLYGFSLALFILGFLERPHISNRPLLKYFSTETYKTLQRMYGVNSGRCRIIGLSELSPAVLLVKSPLSQSDHLWVSVTFKTASRSF